MTNSQFNTEMPGSTHKTSALKTTPTSKMAEHLGYLDGIRALAAIFVVLHHCFIQMRSDTYPSQALKVLQVLGFGRYAVDWFIVLSGFCLMMPVARGDGKMRISTMTFFERRAKRILPTYYAALVISLALIYTLIGEKTGTQWDISLPVTLKSIVSHLFLLHDAVDEEFSINHPFWSVAVEWRIYFLFPLLVLMWRRLGPWVTTFGSIIFSLMLARFLSIKLGFSLTAYYLGLFVMGMLAASLAFSSAPTMDRLRRLPWSIISIVLFLAVVFISDHGHLPHYWADLLVGAWAMAVLVWVSRGHSWGHTLLSFPPLVWIGTFSYSIYLMHAPLIQLLWQYPFASFQKSSLTMFAALAFLGVPLIIGTSYGFFLLFERPFLRKRVVAKPESIVVKTTLEPAP